MGWRSLNVFSLCGPMWAQRPTLTWARAEARHETDFIEANFACWIQTLAKLHTQQHLFAQLISASTLIKDKNLIREHCLLAPTGALLLDPTETMSIDHACLSTGTTTIRGGFPSGKDCQPHAFANITRQQPPHLPQHVHRDLTPYLATKDNPSLWIACHVLLTRQACD